jgi:molybdate transport system substrate-binding protein
MRIHPIRRALLGVCLALALALPAQAAQPALVFAAASLKDALDEITAEWARTGGEAVVSLAGSSALARQIENGAPADVFISANVDWMDALEAQGLIDPTSRIDLLRNRLVLIAHDPAAAPVAIDHAFDLAAMLGDGHLAMALVDAVPAGIYGEAALESLGLWESVAPRVAQAENVRAAMALVASGEAPLGIVYATDATASDGVGVIGTFPEDSHPPILYPAAIVRDSVNPAARDFLAFLRSDAARAAFVRQGFAMAE